ncbi:MAG: hypothetical protein ACPL5F_12455 [Moorellaceae bacterium]
MRRRFGVREESRDGVGCCCSGKAVKRDGKRQSKCGSLRQKARACVAR